MTDGDFESGFPGPWTVSPNLTNSSLSTTVKHAGNASLHVISTAAGTTKSSAIWQNLSTTLTANATYTLEFLVSTKHQRRAVDPAVVWLGYRGDGQSDTPA